MPGEVLTVASGKGGVGKTVTAVNLAVGLRLGGASVVVVDGDIGMPNVGRHTGVSHSPTLHDVLSEDATVREALVEEAEGFGVVPGGGDLDGFAAADPARFAYVVDRLAHEFDAVVIDTGGGLSYENALPLELADAVVLVTSPDPPAVDDTRRTRALVEVIGTPISGLVVTHATPEDSPEAIATDLGVDLLGAVPDDDAVDECVRAGRPLEVVAEESPAAAAYRDIAASFVDEGRPVNRDGAPA
jgi:septum site-determining protein MinD